MRRSDIRLQMREAAAVSYCNSELEIEQLTGRQVSLYSESKICKIFLMFHYNTQAHVVGCSLLKNAVDVVFRISALLSRPHPFFPSLALSLSLFLSVSAHLY